MIKKFEKVREVIVFEFFKFSIVKVLKKCGK